MHDNPATDGRAGSAAIDAAAELHHDWITGLVLALITHAGEQIAAQFVFQLFRRQHLACFLPGLEKLGLQALPHAVAAARYHYFSNQLGGVKVEYLEEHARKAWIRYPPPRWIWRGTAICAIPSTVNHAMLRGWHAHNGVSLNDPCLGFVCTGTTVDGGAGLEGYYQQYDHPIEAEQRLRFVTDEHCPWIDANTLPRLDHEQWPPERAAKAYRNYALRYIRNALPSVLQVMPIEDAQQLAIRAARQVGMHAYDNISERLSVNDSSARSYLWLLSALLNGAGDRVRLNSNSVTREHWRLFDNQPMSADLFPIWLAVYEGLLASHNRTLRLVAEQPHEFRVASR